MDPERVRNLLESVRSGEVEVDRAVERLSVLPFVDAVEARVDTHRAIRQGIPEVVYGAEKTPGQIIEVARALRGESQDVLATRVTSEKAQAVRAALPETRLPLPRLRRLSVPRKFSP